MRFVFLAMLTGGPVHGYDLKRRYDRLFATVWGPLNIGQVYVTMGRLERDGLVDVRPDDGRKLYSLTERGAKELDGWIGSPVEPVAKSDIVLRVVAASLQDPGAVEVVVRDHRTACLATLRALGERRDPAPATGSGPFEELLVRHAELHVESELRWLDVVEARLPVIVGTGRDQRDRTMAERLPAAVQAEDVHRMFGATAVLRGVDLRVDRGEWVALMGPSGSGKSTLLHLLGGLDRPSAGRVLVDGRALHQARPRELAKLRRGTIGFVFQHANLLAHVDVATNVELAARLAGIGRREARRRAASLLDELGLAAFGRFAPAELSGGQQQRVALARALVNEPTVLLADEPTGALDSTATDSVLDILAGVHRRGQTIVVVTHDHRVAARADRIVRLRDGRVLNDDERHALRHPVGVLARPSFDAPYGLSLDGPPLDEDSWDEDSWHDDAAGSR